MNRPPKNIDAVYYLFRSNYKLVPLEIFGNDPYRTLISTLLSARTRDSLTLKISEKLFKLAPDIQSLSKMGEDQIERLIYPVGFYKTKARHIKALAKQIISNFQGNIPNTRDELMSLPGVGRKTANLVLNRAFSIPAIAVDTHVHRISNILGWIKTETPEDSEKELTKIIPENYWSEMNRLFVSIGQQYRSKRQIENFLKQNKLI